MSYKKEQTMALAKNSNAKELKRYFASVSKLTLSGSNYPVNLDHVWPLVYSRKDSATKVLLEEFIEGEDFLLRQKAEQKNGRGGHNADFYELSVSCMEYLVARKVRAVFDVYRTFFHSTNTPVNGVMPMLCNGILGYPRKEVLVSIGRSYKNGYRLKRKFADDCFFIGRTACISFNLATLLQKQFDVRQLELNFNEKGGSHEA